MGESRRSRTLVAYAAALWSLIFATFHIIWASGWYIGLNQEQARIAFRRPLFFAYDVVVAGMCLLALFVALALVQSWGRYVPQRVLRFFVWAATGLLVLRAVASVIETVYLLLVRRFSFAVIGIWEPWFYLGAILFSVTTWQYEAAHRRDVSDGQAWLVPPRPEATSMTETPISRDSATEAWLREVFDHFFRELVLFSRTFIAFCFHPGRSAREWQTGERVFMNPLGFAAIAAGVYWSVVSVVAALWPIPGSEPSDTLAGQLTSAVGPYVHYGLLGIAMHFVLRWLGSRRRILGSIGIAFFAGGSIGTLTALIVTTIAHWFGHERGTSNLELREGDLIPFILLSAAVVSYALVVMSMARAFVKLHRTAGWKAMIAAAFAVVATALLFGSVLTNGDYGWRPYIGVDLKGGLPFSFGFRG